MKEKLRYPPPLSQPEKLHDRNAGKRSNSHCQRERYHFRQELMFTDNDELSGLIASMMDAQVLIIPQQYRRHLHGSPADPASEVIRKIEHGKDLSSYIQTSKSSFGRGGMLTKPILPVKWPMRELPLSSPTASATISQTCCIRNSLPIPRCSIPLLSILN